MREYDLKIYNEYDCLAKETCCNAEYNWFLEVKGVLENEICYIQDDNDNTLIQNKNIVGVWKVSDRKQFQNPAR